MAGAKPYAAVMVESTEARWRRLRHDLRGAYHQMRLCIDVLDSESDPAARIEWLSQIWAAAERGEGIAAEIEETVDADLLFNHSTADAP